MIDLRSDTVTRPTPRMREAMASAEVGDDVYGEDPTVHALEEAAAARFGRQAALFCASGVLCNQLWLRVLGRPGREVLCDADSHVVNYEAGAGALLAGVQFRTLVGDRGRLRAEEVAAWTRPDAFPLTPTQLIWIEQTHNRHGGAVYPLTWLRQLREVTASAGVALYMDGARVLHASVAHGVDPAEYGSVVDGLSFCASKALGAPVGSLMVGDADAIAEARAWRRRYGGAMRQAGVLAAAALVAIEERVERLIEDHQKAQLLARAAGEALPGGIDPATVETNIVVVEGVDAAMAVRLLGEEGVRAGALDGGTLRLVTHPDVTEEDCRRAAEALRRVLPALSSHGVAER